MNALMKTLKEWEAAKVAAEEAKLVIARELELRQKVVKMFFPEAKEGTNSMDMNAGWKLKAVYKLTRKVDAAALTTMLPVLREKAVPVDTLFQWKPELKVSVYREMTPEQLALIDQVITTSPASPELQLIPPKTSSK